MYFRRAVRERRVKDLVTRGTGLVPQPRYLATSLPMS